LGKCHERRHGGIFYSGDSAFNIDGAVTGRFPLPSGEDSRYISGIVTGAVGIRYLVLVTLIVTRSLKLLTHSAESQALHGRSQSLYSYRPSEAYVYRKHARKNSIKYKKNIATNTTGYDKETCLNMHKKRILLDNF